MISLRSQFDYRFKVESELNKLCYTDKMFYFTGTPYVTNFDYLFKGYFKEKDDETNGRIVKLCFVTLNYEEEEPSVVGYFSYSVDIHKNCAYDLSVITFTPSVEVIKEVVEETEALIKRFHRVEWTVIAGSGQEKFYDDFCKKHNGHRIVLRDAVKDQYGKYHDKYIYEIVNK